MKFDLVRFDPARHAALLTRFLCAHEWPFHGCLRPGPEVVARWLAEGRFDGDDARSAWVLAGEEPAGLIALQEIGDATPVFDLRVAAPWRRRGVGRRALAWAVEESFGPLDKRRLEAHTRADNGPMRGLLRAEPGWVQEAHHRQAWPDHQGGWVDAVTYALLRDDRARGARTPVPPLEP